MDTHRNRRSLTRTAVGLAVCAPLHFLAAVTASADTYDGTYDVETPLGQIGEWTITSCGDGCSLIQLNGGSKKADPDMATGAVADDQQIHGGQGTFTANPTSTCPDKTSLTQAQTFSVDLTTMTGTVAVIPLRCAIHGGTDDPPFTRTFILAKL